MTGTRVHIEIGARRVFACACDWPGWCRSGRDEARALEALGAYLPRYAPVAREAGLQPPSDRFEVVERVTGRAASIDFGVPSETTAADAGPIDSAEAARLAALLRAAWVTFDRVVAGSPAELRRGPRGGGRDRDRMVEHVLGAEAGYAPRLGVRFRQPAVGDTDAIEAARAAIVAAIGPSDGGPLVARGWLPRYAVRRIAWHVLDHAWE